MASFLIENQTVFSFYPYAESASVWEIAVNDHEPCFNPFEGRVRGACGAQRVALFDTLYFRNRTMYTPGEALPFEVSAIAYSLEPGDSPILAWDETNEDEIVFCAKVEAVEEAPFWDIPMYAYAVHLEAGDTRLPLTLYAPGDAQPQPFEPGALIQGKAWLFGQVRPREDDSVSTAAQADAASEPAD